MSIDNPLNTLLVVAAVLLVVNVLIMLFSKIIKKTAVPSGYRFLVVDVLGRVFTLVEISALQRLEYLKRCMKLNASDGFEFMRDDLIVSTELIALHLRRWYLPSWFISYQLRRLSAAAIAELFRNCVELSNLPFSISKDDDQERAATAEPDTESDPDNEWDYVDDDGEKKQRPVVRQ